MPDTITGDVAVDITSFVDMLGDIVIDPGLDSTSSATLNLLGIRSVSANLAGTASAALTAQSIKMPTGILDRTALVIGSVLGDSRRFAMQSRHGTLVADTPTVVTVTGVAVEVVNRTIQVGTFGGEPYDGADIFFTVDGSVPTVAGNDTYVTSGVAGARTAVNANRYKDTITVTMISSGTPDYSVIATDTAYVQN